MFIHHAREPSVHRIRPPEIFRIKWGDFYFVGISRDPSGHLKSQWTDSREDAKRYFSLEDAEIDTGQNLFSVDIVASST